MKDRKTLVIRAKSVKGLVYLKSGLKRWTPDVFKAGMFERNEAETCLTRVRSAFNAILTEFRTCDTQSERRRVIGGS